MFVRGTESEKEEEKGEGEEEGEEKEEIPTHQSHFNHCFSDIIVNSNLILTFSKGHY